MHVDKLKYYIDLYDCRSFTETAKKNFISQAALSQFISSLEKQFGLVFFNRNVTPIEPTVAGSRFYEESKILYRQYENMLNEMTRIKEDVLPPLRIAYSSTVDIQALLPYIPVFKEKYPNAELQLNKIKLKEAHDYIENGLCDIVISFSTEFIDDERIRHKVLKEGPYRAIVGMGHELFNREVITTEELYRCPLIMLSRNVIGDLYDKMIDRAKDDGFEPIIEKAVEDIDTEMFSIITEGYIGFVPESQELSDYGEATRCIPIVGSSHRYIVSAGYLKDNKNLTLKAFIEMI